MSEKFLVYRCPRAACKSVRGIEVEVRAAFQLNQSVNMGEVVCHTTQGSTLHGSHEWGSNSPMWCKACGYTAAAKAFETRMTIPEFYAALGEEQAD